MLCLSTDFLITNKLYILKSCSGFDMALSWKYNYQANVEMCHFSLFFHTFIYFSSSCILLFHHTKCPIMISHSVPIRRRQFFQLNFLLFKHDLYAFWYNLKLLQYTNFKLLFQLLTINSLHFIWLSFKIIVNWYLVNR